MGQPPIKKMRRYFMMKRRIFPWMGLIVLFLSFGIGRETLAQEVYKVKQGDNISLIAKKYGVSPDALKAANNLGGNKIKSNQVLTIPRQAKQKIVKAKKSPAPADSYRVKKGDSIYSIARKAGLSVSEIKEINHLRNSSLKPGQKILLAKSAPAQDMGKTERPAGLSDMDDLEEDGDLAGDPPENAPLTETEKNSPSDAELLGKWHNPEERKLFVQVATASLGAPA